MPKHKHSDSPLRSIPSEHKLTRAQSPEESEFDRSLLTDEIRDSIINNGGIVQNFDVFSTLEKAFPRKL